MAHLGFGANWKCDQSCPKRKFRSYSIAKTLQGVLSRALQLCPIVDIQLDIVRYRHHR